MLKRQNETIRATEPQHDGNTADLECVRRIAAGDTASVGDLYDHHATAMYSLALSILDRETDAGDVVHDVFAQVCREAGGDSASRGFVAAWLLTLTRNRAIHRLWLRAEADPQGAGAGPGWRRTSSVADDPPEAMLKFDAPERVRDALRALPDLERIAIEMTYFEGLSQQEIATRLEQPLGTVTSRVSLALLTLRAAITWEVR